jgi:signal transduction histidine kinase
MLGSVFPKKPFISLRLKIVLVVALPMFITLAGLSLYHYYRERQALLKQLDDNAYNFGEAIAGSLRHAMLARDQSMLETTLQEISVQPSILNIALYNTESDLVATNNPEYFDPAINRSSPGCVECHGQENYQDLQSLVIRTPLKEDMLRTSVPIRNEPDCYSCHASDRDVLGVLMLDFSLQSMESHIVNDITYNLMISLLITLMASIAVYYWIEVLIIRRLELFRKPIEHFGDGEFSARVTVDRSLRDEITTLQNGFNNMAVELERRAEAESNAVDARLQAIIEERKRLARELHDSTAQVLAYVTTKAAAVRIFIEKNNREEAVVELNQLEAASRSVFADIRQAIMDLNTVPEEDWDIVFLLRTYVNSFQRYSQIPVTFVVDRVEDVKLAPEVYLQILRIVQESLANVRKHSNASKVEVGVSVDSMNNLVVRIADNGVGFEPGSPNIDPDMHFGLHSMQERAQAIGAGLEITSARGEGTELKLVIPLIGKGEA